MTEERNYRVNEMFWSVQGEGRLAGSTAFFIRLQGCPIGCEWCLGGATKIQLLEGPQKRIRDVVVGDVLIGYDERTGLLAPTTVTATHAHEADSLWVVDDPGGHYNMTTICTGDHPWMTTTRGWVRTEQLQQSDELFTSADFDLRRWQKVHANPMQRADVAARVSTTMEGYWTPERRDAQRERQRRLVCHSENMRGNRNPMKRPDVVARQVETMRQRGYDHVSAMEARVARIVEEMGLPYTHCRMRHRVGRRYPDFIIEGTNKVVEVYDPRYLNREANGYATTARDEYAGVGATCLPLRVGRTTTDAEIGAELTRFALNGKRPGGVHPLSEMADRARGRDHTVYDITCEPYPTFFANGWLSHNCDSPMTWYAGGVAMTLTEIEADMRTAPLSELVVVTGGEPLIHDLDPLLTMLRERFPSRRICLETSGVFPFRGQERGDWVTVSPKYPRNFQVETNVLRHAAELKYVVDPHFTLAVADAHLREYAEVRAHWDAIPAVVLMPEGSPPRPENIARALEMLRDRPAFYFGPRLQYEYAAIGAAEGENNAEHSREEARERARGRGAQRR